MSVAHSDDKWFTNHIYAEGRDATLIKYVCVGKMITSACTYGPVFLFFILCVCVCTCVYLCVCICMHACMRKTQLN